MLSCIDVAVVFSMFIEIEFNSVTIPIESSVFSIFIEIEFYKNSTNRHNQEVLALEAIILIMTVFIAVLTWILNR